MIIARHKLLWLAGVAALVWLTLAGMSAERASAFSGAPQWTVSVVSAPTNFAPDDHSGKDFYIVRVTNTGDVPSDGSTVTIADALPAGLALDHAGVSGIELIKGASLSCTGPTCTYKGVVPVDDTLTMRIPVDVEPTAKEAETDHVSVTGGGAAEASASTTTTISTVATGFGLVPGSLSIVPSDAQAGAHADLTTTFYLNTNNDHETEGHLRTVVVDLPSGFAGDPNAMPTCNERQLVGTGGGVAECPVSSQIGTMSLPLYLFLNEPPVQVTVPVFNMETVPGTLAVFGFNIAGIVVQDLYVKLRPDDSGLEVTTANITGTAAVQGASLTVWGVPAESIHDPLRGAVCIEYSCEGGGQPAGVVPEPFLSNPTACTEAPLTATMNLDSWEHSVASEPVATPIGPLTGCERLEFDPSLTIQSTTDNASSSSGLNANISIPQSYGNPVALATSNLENAVVTLPEGITVNPSAGVGLGACTPAEYTAETLDSLPGEGCPTNSNLGTVTIRTPVLKEEATGTIYLAQPYNNPSDSLLALYIVARIPQRGVIVKVAGKVEPNPLTGQLVTTFDNNPQLPFNEFVLSFRQGQTSPLVSPPACGAYQAQAELTPWSSPLQAFQLDSTFEITNGVDGGPCPSGGTPPFDPQVIAGTENNDAGAYSPFYLRIIRQDGEQELTKFSTVLPGGLSGVLSGIPFCPVADIESARTVTGREETEHPSCPAASEIGHSITEAGVGSVLARAPGKIYLAGPYHGAPFSVVSITSATVGPFDLGTVVIRFALNINPVTAQVEISGAGSDPIPHIIDGIVVHVRDVRVYVDREKFVVNPTSCDPMSIGDTITGAGANPANPADQDSVTAATRFQAADCDSLKFAPEFKVSTSGRTSRAGGASLYVSLNYPNAPFGSQANIAKVKVDLPRQLPSRLTTLQQACPARTFAANPASCPSASVVGHAVVHTQLLPVPLEGPAYFVSHGGEAFPNLIIALQGYGVSVDLVGDTFIKNGVTSSTFAATPDVPFEDFELTLPEGPYSALAANGDLCQEKLVMPTAFTGQNGATLKQSTRIQPSGCPGALSVLSKRVSGRSVKVGVYVPAAGRLTISGGGVSSTGASASGPEALSLTLHRRGAGKLTSRLKVAFTPSRGRGQTRTVTVTFGG